MPDRTAPNRYAENAIRVRGVRVHNLRGIDADIPRDRLVVMTGVSGSGKSSLAFDTLFAEGQRRYLESLSTYTRQFLDQLERPDVDLIDGSPPTISIDQRSGSVQPRSTLATTTEIYDYLRLLYARAGQAHCTGCGRAVSRQSSQAIVDHILSLEERRKVMILAPVVRGRKGQHREVFERICKDGFVRARVDGEVADASDPPKLARTKTHDVDVVVDRIIVKQGIRPRLQESVDLAVKLGEGTCVVCQQDGDAWSDRLYSTRFACPDCQLGFSGLEPRSFSFNSPYGACPDCDGLGVVVDDGPDRSTDSFASPVCPSCGGGRLNEFARRVTVAGLPIQELTARTVAGASEFVERLLAALRPHDPGAPTGAGLQTESDSVLSGEAKLVAEKTVPDIAARLEFLIKVGLDYVTLNRPTRTLSGGEFQRARLAGCLGSGLIGVGYVLDEPTIGLHARDTGRLIRALQELRDRGNSVLVVEHDAEMIRHADHLIDLGPGAGREGGRLVAEGSPELVLRNPDSLTAKFLGNGHRPAARRQRRAVDDRPRLELRKVRRHNLQDITASIPLEVLTCVTGVSGSGKSSLVTQTLLPALHQALNDDRPPSGPFEELRGAEHLDRAVEVDQSPIGRSGRSNPATYSGLWDEVRRAFAQTKDARLRGYTARRFSFNARQGRCEACKGQGSQRIEMRFMPDMHVTCPSCKGDRFNRQTLAVRFAGKNAAEVLKMRFDEALEFFSNFPKLKAVLQTFCDVGLGYLSLGQSSLTLSGGEAQRVKLATELSRSRSAPTLYVLDEPTTGLHAADIDRLLAVLHQLVDQGHSVLVIEHQLDVVASADWLIDLGPEGGAAGGRIVAQGRPEEVCRIEDNATGIALADYFTQRSGAGQ